MWYGIAFFTMYTNRSYIIQVFAEGSTSRGKLKTIARTMVGIFYSSILVADEVFVGNQLEEQGIIQRQVENVLEGGVYLEGPKDAEVYYPSFSSCNNFLISS